MADLQRVINRLGCRFAARRRAGGDSTRPTPGQVPFDFRPDPTGFVQPRLFNRSKHPYRPYLQGIPIKLPNIGLISYRGQELREDDWAVWLQLMTLSRRQASASWLEFSPLTLLKTMGWGTGAHACARLRDCLERMQATVLRLPGGQSATTLALSMIVKCEWLSSSGGRSGRWRVWIEPEVRALFLNCLS